jgi:hypothetical protein
MFFANRVLLWIDTSLVGTTPIGVKSRDAKWFQQGLQLEKDFGQPSKRICGVK